MMAGDVVVTTNRAGDDGTSASWHLDCFICWKCREPLANLVYFWTSERLYCGRHHAETIRPRCFGCDEVSRAEKNLTTNLRKT